MDHHRQLDQHSAWRAIGKLQVGRTQLEVANTIGVPKSVISRLWRRYRDTRTVERRQGQGRPRSTSP